jgi:VanZ family protein
MEYCQGFVPGRAPSWLDALANTSGVTIGFVLTLIYRKLNLGLFK